MTISPYDYLHPAIGDPQNPQRWDNALQIARGWIQTKIASIHSRIDALKDDHPLFHQKHLINIIENYLLWDEIFCTTVLVDQFFRRVIEKADHRPTQLGEQPKASSAAPLSPEQLLDKYFALPSADALRWTLLYPSEMAVGNPDPHVQSMDRANTLEITLYAVTRLHGALPIFSCSSMTELFPRLWPLKKRGAKLDSLLSEPWVCQYPSRPFLGLSPPLFSGNQYDGVQRRRKHQKSEQIHRIHRMALCLLEDGWGCIHPHLQKHWEDLVKEIVFSSPSLFDHLVKLFQQTPIEEGIVQFCYANFLSKHFNLQTASKYYEQFLLQHPTTDKKKDFLYRLAFIYLELSKVLDTIHHIVFYGPLRFARAIEYFKAAQALDPDPIDRLKNPPGGEWVGNIYWEWMKENGRRMIDCFETRDVEIRRVARGLLEHGEACRTFGCLQMAARSLQESMKLASSARAAANLGVVYQAKGDLALAHRYLLQAKRGEYICPEGDLSKVDDLTYEGFSALYRLSSSWKSLISTEKLRELIFSYLGDDPESGQTVVALILLHYRSQSLTDVLARSFLRPFCSSVLRMPRRRSYRLKNCCVELFYSLYHSQFVFAKDKELQIPTLWLRKANLPHVTLLRLSRGAVETEVLPFWKGGLPCFLQKKDGPWEEGEVELSPKILKTFYEKREQIEIRDWLLEKALAPVVLPRTIYEIDSVLRPSLFDAVQHLLTRNKEPSIPFLSPLEEVVDAWNALISGLRLHGQEFGSMVPLPRELPSGISVLV